MTTSTTSHVRPIVVALIATVFATGWMPHLRAEANSPVNYFVSPSGNDTDGLSEATAFRNPQRAADLSKPGDTILIMDGWYESGPTSNSISITRSGTAGAPITFRAFPGARPVLKAQAWEGVSVQGASHIVIEGLTVEGVAKEITLDEALKAQQGAVVPPRYANNCFAVTRGESGNLSHHVTIRDNIARNCSGGGIYTLGADYVTIEYNDVYDNGWWSSWGNSGISMYQSRDVDNFAGTKMVIRNNFVWGNANFVPFRFSDPDPARRVITDGNGIIVDDLRNTQSFVGSSSVPYRGRTLVENNVSVGNGARGIHVFLSDRVDVINNTTAGNSWSAAIAEGDISVIDSDDVFVGNNIAAADPGVPALTVQAGGGRVWVGTNLTTGDPKFVDRDQGDFRLLDGSPAIDTGDARVASEQDVTGQARPLGGGPDLGAFER